MNISESTSAIKTNILFVTLALLAVFLVGCMPTPPADDNTNTTFIKEMVPKVIGRKAAGADEIEVLADISSLLGREAAIRTLMAQDDYVDHWTDVIVDHLQVQREGPRFQPSACFASPLRVDASGDPISDGGALAEFIRDNVATAVAPGGSFNMVDVIRSSIELDDLSPVYRAYAFVLNSRPGFGTAEQQRTNVGGPFNHIYANKQINCLGCHNSSFSTTNSPEWQRTHALPLALETAVYGSVTGNLSENYGFLGGFGGGQPWNMSSCGSINSSVSAAVATDFAGVTGNGVSMLDIDAQFKAGYESTKLNGVTRISNSPNLPDVDGDEGYAFMVAATITQNIWQEIMGEKLTIANYYARNKDQMNAHWNLTEFGLIPSSWSLKELIVRIMDTRFYNRKAPSQSSGCDRPDGTGSTAYCLQMVFDPWVERDPRVPDAELDDPNDPKIYKNGQGELVHRYSPRTLLNSVAEALGWPKPKRYPNTSYPSVDLATSIGQYRSDSKQGTKGVDFQGLLNWESQFGVCEKPAGVGLDWIDQFANSVNTFDAANPGSPLTVQDAAITMKDWLIQEQQIDSATPVGLDVGRNEQLALSELFDATLNTQLSTVPNFEQKLRSYCGVLLQTPDFMLAGIRESNALTLPRHRVCNAGQPCTYSEICTEYGSALADLGQPISCFGRSVSHAITRVSFTGATLLDKICLNNDCGFIRAPKVLACVDQPEICRLKEVPPPCDPRWCDPSPIDFDKPQVILINAERAAVSKTKGATIIREGEGKPVRLEKGAKLAKGDVLLLPEGAHLNIENEKKVFATPEKGMFSANDLRVRKIDLALLESVQKGDIKQVQALVKEGANVNVADRFGESALMYSIRKRNSKMAYYLMKLNANINQKDNRGLRAIEIAQLSDDSRSLKFLQERGAILNPKLVERGKKIKPRENPWIMLVTGPDEGRIRPSKKGQVMSMREVLQLSQAGKLRTQNKDIREIQEHWKKTKFHSRGDAGALVNQKQAKKALDEYMKNTFKLEHDEKSREQSKY